MHAPTTVKERLVGNLMGVRSRTATLLSLRDISPDRGISHGSAPTVVIECLIIIEMLVVSETSAPSVTA